MGRPRLKEIDEREMIQRERMRLAPCRSWDQVAAEFNRRHGTDLSYRYITILGNKAMEKIRKAMTN